MAEGCLSLPEEGCVDGLNTKKAGHADRVVDMPRLMGGCEGSVPTAEGAIDHVVEIGVVPGLGVVAHP